MICRSPSHSRCALHPDSAGTAWPIESPASKSHDHVYPINDASYMCWRGCIDERGRLRQAGCLSSPVLQPPQYFIAPFRQTRQEKRQHVITGRTQFSFHTDKMWHRKCFCITAEHLNDAKVSVCVCVCFSVTVVVLWRFFWSVASWNLTEWDHTWCRLQK